MILTVTLLHLLIGCLWFFLKYHFSYWQRRHVPHNKPQIPVGNMKDWMHTKHFAEIFQETYKKFKGTGPFAGFFFNMQKAVIVLDLELAKNILIKDFSSFEHRGLFHNEKDDPLTGNLFSLDGPKWRTLRAKLSPTFTSGKMKYMFPTVVKVGEELQIVMEETIDKEDNILEITNFLGRYTADVIGSCAFGLDCLSLKDPNAEFCLMGRKFFTQRRHSATVEGLIHAFPEMAKFLRMKVIPQTVNDFYIRIVKETIKYREEHKVKRFDFMDLLLELKNQKDATFTLEELAAQAFVFLVAGFDTSSTTISYALYELAQNQDIQNKLREEMEKVMKKFKQDFSYACLKEMKYLEQVIAETLRKYPVAPALFRKSTNHYKTADPRYCIDKNTMIIIPSHSYHHDPEYFPEPEKFNPERFSPMHISAIKSSSYLPFGSGPRNCIGMRFGRMQTGIGLVFLIRHFHFDVCEKTKTPIEFIKPSFNLNPTGGITLKVTKIQRD